MHLVIVRPRAQRQIDAAINWWLGNRDKAPDAFIEELAETLELIAHNAGAGVPVRTRRAGVRRILMERVRYYLYYRRLPDDIVEVVFVWHASRRAPRI
jgi:plasmid stabilization system protein ParE